MFGEQSVLEINISNGEINIINPKLMPYGLYLDKQDNFNNLINFYNWLSNRMLPIERKYIKEILNYLNLKQSTTDIERAKIVMEYHSVSVSDIYWTKEDDENADWNSINIFDNSLNEAIFDVALHGKNLTIQTQGLVSQDINVQGYYPKAWKRLDDGLYLFKADVEGSVDKEVTASSILDILGIPHLEYSYSFYDGEKTSLCKCITNKKISMVSAQDMEIWCTNKDISLIDFTIKLDSMGYAYMNLADYLVGNNDRHLGNWGFLVDEENQVLCLHPLFDFNSSFKTTGIKGGLCLPENNKITQLEAARRALRYIDIPKCNPVPRNIFINEEDYDLFNRRYNELLKTKVNSK